MERSILADNAESNSPRPLYRMSIISLLVLGSSYSVDALLVIRSQFTGPDPNMSALPFFTLVSTVLGSLNSNYNCILTFDVKNS